MGCGIDKVTLDEKRLSRTRLDFKGAHSIVVRVSVKSCQVYAQEGLVGSCSAIRWLGLNLQCTSVPLVMECYQFT